jgi:hypothetical protein
MRIYRVLPYVMCLVIVFDFFSWVKERIILLSHINIRTGRSNLCSHQQCLERRVRIMLSHIIIRTDCSNLCFPPNMLERYVRIMFASYRGVGRVCLCLCQCLYFDVQPSLPPPHPYISKTQVFEFKV